MAASDPESSRPRRLAAVSALLGGLTLASFVLAVVYVVFFTRAGREPGNPLVGNTLAILYAGSGVLALWTGVLGLFQLPKTLTNMERRFCAWFGAVVGLCATANNAIAFLCYLLYE